MVKRFQSRSTFGSIFSFDPVTRYMFAHYSMAGWWGALGCRALTRRYGFLACDNAHLSQAMLHRSSQIRSDGNSLPRMNCTLPGEGARKRERRNG
jgi:hypothetical protein